ncbi:hypothetical protein KOI35_30775 [Actinoplanes bogorensis]|uniref:Uncharacterized protein n=1 Tax=Paractinoplanes bogorensis TaxID=1610840 RepID=A0ABS5YWS8_9ACTN|nr:hypothetical protein [Actinoplanes bogorensis]MBU2667904.1 hypothetical protein [Actinoplanes bogorensis]
MRAFGGKRPVVVLSGFPRPRGFLVHDLLGAPGPRPGVPLEQLDVPWTNELEPSPSTMFHDPKDRTADYFLPEYRLAERQVAGEVRYEMALRPDGPAWLLSVALQARRPASAPETSRPLPHQPGVRLIHSRAVDGGGTVDEALDLTVRTTEDGCVAVAPIATLALRDAVFHALTKADSRPRLVVQRSFEAAVRLDLPPPAREVIDLLSLSPRATWNGAQLTDPGGNTIDGADLPFNGNDGDDRGFVILTDGMPMEDGTRRRALRMHPKWVTNGTIKGWHPDVPLPPGAVFEAEVGFVNGAVHTDGVDFIVFEHHTLPGGGRTWNELLRHHKGYTRALDPIRIDLSGLAGTAVGIELRVDAGPSSAQDWAAWVGPRIVGAEPGAEPDRYLAGRHDLPQPNVFPVPFFDPQLHPGIFTGIGGIGDPPPLTRHTVVFRGTPHHYYEQSDTPGRFLYLPDAFKLGRRATAPFTPSLLVSFTAPDGLVENVQAELSYVAYPVVDPDRLDAAVAELRAQVPLLPADAEVRFDCLRADPARLTLRLALPRPGGGVVREVRPGAVVALDREINDTVTLDRTGFQSVFNALMGAGTSALFAGEVLVAVDPQESLVVPLVARIGDLAGALFEQTQEAAGPGRVRVVLTNRTESPVRVPALPVRLTAPGFDVAAVVSEVSLDGAGAEWPVEVPPESALAFVAAAEGATPPAGPLTATYDLDQVTTRPDRLKVFDAVIDRAVPPPLRHALRVTVFRDVFDVHADLRRIVVDFSAGESVEFARTDFPAGISESTRTATLPVPLRAVIDQGDSIGDYRYRVRAVDKLGTVRTSGWLVVTSPLFPDLASIDGPTP